MDIPFPRGLGDIQTAVVNRIDRLARVIPLSQQPAFAPAIAEMIAGRPSTMGSSMFIRQSIILGQLAAWLAVPRCCGNLKKTE